ncbi:MAG: hypothetical protein GEV10_06530 [Streptosporangiales bacterium]|nr:hypothetical protein [Streptosporangiales bacterium]
MAATYPRGVRKLLLTPKWLGMTALALLLIAAFIGLAYWQLQRGEAGNARSWGYAFQWPAFAIFVVYMWIRMLREELNPQLDPPHSAERAAGDPLPGAASAEVEPYEDDDADPEADAELAEYNRWLTELNRRSERVGR